MKKINKLSIFVLLILNIYFLIKYIINFNATRVVICLFLPILIFLPAIFKNKLNSKLEFMYYIYLLLLLVLGCLARFYSIFKYYDLFTHFIFGIASSVIGLYILKKFDMNNKNKLIFNVIFMIFTTLSIATFWEIFEFAASIITEDDIQHVIDTGINDTMKDIISSLFCSIIFSIIYYFKQNKIEQLIE